MDRKKLLFGLGAVSGGATIIGSGAFSSMRAERSVNVEVAGDKSALLALEPVAGPNGQYATIENGMLGVQVSAENNQVSGGGINPSSRYDLGKVFKITNQGTQPVGVWIEHDSEYVAFQTEGKPLDDDETPVSVDSGNSLPVRILVDTRDVDSNVDTLLDEITIHAAATDADAPSAPKPPDVAVTRSIDSTTVTRGGELTVTLTINASSTANIDIFERFNPDVGTATFESTTMDGSDISPSFIDLDAGGGVVLLNGVGPGELMVEYSLSIAGNAPTGTVSLQPNLIDIDEQAVPVDGADTIEVMA